MAGDGELVGHGHADGREQLRRVLRGVGGQGGAQLALDHVGDDVGRHRHDDERGVVAVVGSLHTVVTMVLARFVLHERLAAVQRIGIGTSLAGVLAISAG